MDLEALLSHCDALESFDEQLRLCLEGMRAALAQEGRADLRSFWEVRSRCVGLFRQPINPALRSHCWSEYCELTREARLLREENLRESAFTKEQFELAIDALEKELSSKVVIDSALPKTYAALQSELDRLDVCGKRLKVLREGLSGLSARGKGRLFEALSEIGARLFPRRKELIGEVTALFSNEVSHFSLDLRRPLHETREEIKRLQALAKRLTLTAHCFSESRKRLSELWDQVREEGRRRKAVRLERQEEAEALQAQLLEELMALGAKIDDPGVNGEESALRLNELMRRIHPCEEVEEVRRKVEIRVRKDQKSREERLSALRERIEGVVAEEEIDELRREIALVGLSKGEQQVMQQRLDGLFARFEAERERNLLDGEASQEVASKVLEARRRRRRELKGQLDGLRRKGGSSGLDFEQALLNQEMIEASRLRLEEIDGLIEELESR